MIKILFLGANPSDSTRLAIDREVREITQRLRATPHGARFEIEQEWAVQVSDLQAALLRHRPDIVHFSGRGRATGEILVENEKGKAVPIPLSALADLFRILGDSIRCVVLNACYSEHQAEAIQRNIDCVIGMSRALKGAASVAFSGAFYQTLGFGRPIKTAFELGKNQIDLTGLLDADVPKLLVREGVDVARIAWAQGDSSASRVNEPARSSAAVARVLLPNDLKAAPFTGRTGELTAIDRAFADRERAQVFVLFGSPGVGKSRLALEFATRHRARYPGGAFFLPWDGAPPSKLAELLGVVGLPKYPDERIEDQCLRVLAHIGGEPTLLVYDNVPNDEALSDWLPVAGGKCHVLVTSTCTYWPASVGSCGVGLLPDADGHVLVSRLVRDPGATRRYGERIVERARGITMELCAVARSVDYEVRHGREASIRAALAADTASSFGGAWRLLSEDARLLLRVACLFAIGRIPPVALRALLAEEGWDEARFEASLDAVRDRGLLTAAAEAFDVHQLAAHFVREQRAPEAPGTLLRRHFEAFAAAAGEFAEHPGDGQRRTRLLAYPVEIGFWAAFAATAPALAEHAHTVGDGLIETGHFADALPWYERAVEAQQKGDVHGCVDHQRLGSSLHHVGRCHWSVNRVDEARTWYERAVEAKQKGDIHGCVDHRSLGVSLHQVGFYHWVVGRIDEALLWYERAVEAAQKGDIHGRVNHQSLGWSLHHVGLCHLKVDRFDEARPWFERSLEAKQKGDLHGRVDHASIGNTLYQMGFCHMSVGRYHEALTWLECAVEAAQQGDVHGRVNHAKLGNSLHLMGVCHAWVGYFVEALLWFERAVDAMQKGDVHGRVDQKNLRISLKAVRYCREMLGLER
jgi:tetratricopeptide (TPR) repeat protein